MSQCEDQNVFCTYTSLDKPDNVGANTTSDTAQREDPKDFCIYPSFDKPDNISDITIDSTPPGTEGTLCKFISDEQNSSASREYVSQSNPSNHKSNDMPNSISVTIVKPNTSITRNPPKLDQATWEKYDREYSDINQKSWNCLKKGLTTPEQFVTDLNGTLASFLKTKPEFIKSHKEFFEHTTKDKDPLEEARKLKIDLNKIAKLPDATDEDKTNARESIRMYSYMLKVNKEKVEATKAREEDKAFRKDFWNTAKQVTNGTFGEPPSRPTFSKSTANQFYKEKYEKPTVINIEDLEWFPSVEPPTKEYNLSPYTPKDIKMALKKKNKNSAPGYDEIVYEYLFNMPSLHRSLATAFTQIRDQGVAPDSWGASKVILIKKKADDPDDIPANFRMISLTLNIGKLYHTLESQRTMQFMLENNYMDKTAQKAYVEGVHGCVEHVMVVQEIIQQAKLHKKTVHITWLDLEDASGSVPHEIIPFIMSHYHIPKRIIAYITSLYTKLIGKVCTQDWETDFFKFLKGVFQGDPYSGVIFLVVFNPLIEYIKKYKETHGYTIKTETKGAHSVITTPFADDFNLITHNKNMHQALLTEIETKIKSMGLVIKPKKCRSLSIQGGKTVNIQFTLKYEVLNDNVSIASVIEKPLKFLGSDVCGTNSPSVMFASIFDKLKTKLENINKSTLRGEYKTQIYSRYALPSMRFFSPPTTQVS